MAEINLKNKLSLENIEKYISSVKNLEDKSKNNIDELEFFSNELRQLKKILDEELDDFHSLELNIETKKVQIKNLNEKINFNDNELESMTGNIEI